MYALNLLYFARLYILPKRGTTKPHGLKLFLRKDGRSRSANPLVDWIVQSLFPFRILTRASALDRSKAPHGFKDSQAWVWLSSRTPRSEWGKQQLVSCRHLNPRLSLHAYKYGDPLPTTLSLSQAFSSTTSSVSARRNSDISPITHSSVR